MSAKAGFGDEYLKDEVHQVYELKSESMVAWG